MVAVAPVFCCFCRERGHKKNSASKPCWKSSWIQQRLPWDFMRFHSKSGSEQLSELYTSHTIHVWPFRNQHVQVPCRVPRQGHYTNQRPFFQKRAKVSVIWKIKVIASTAIKSSVKKNGWRMDTFPPSPKTIPFRILRAINRHQKARTQLLRSNGTTHPFNVKLYLPHSRSSHIHTLELFIASL